LVISFPSFPVLGCVCARTRRRQELGNDIQAQLFSPRVRPSVVLNSPHTRR
jgi:hypothetical protein